MKLHRQVGYRDMHMRIANKIQRKRAKKKSVYSIYLLNLLLGLITGSNMSELEPYVRPGV
ncbi:hypothetical protein ASPVEDRAFT_289665 [Aspergillus versicolor CBS 583.65]|uniref:Uncharacterized protein n=1 Tax=Aspergillus versicolor CBS 583.65 TaxID=1036611 RepID=A0A1L9P7C0_ASPVE|nr:uncharacterized protein ASPVEDRAFT_289665 [Aspergillus versicolor CBS 583.65]OJI97376.1 hypothetical protein ASPVEDRAFT_289665 [Aspergillus versicolor CBS 583.65]